MYDATLHQPTPPNLPSSSFHSGPSHLSTSPDTRQLASAASSSSSASSSSYSTPDSLFEEARRRSLGSMSSQGSNGQAISPLKAFESDSVFGFTKAAALPAVEPVPLGVSPTSHFDDADEGLPYLASNVSPSSSISTSVSRGEATPRAELPPPVWPLTTFKPEPDRHEAGEPMDMSHHDTSFISRITPSKHDRSRDTSLRRDGSWRKKHASLDTPPNAPSFSFPNFEALRATPPLSSPVMEHNRPPLDRLDTQMAPRPPVARAFAAPPARHESPDSPISPSRIVAQSPSTGCVISAPIGAPAHYPQAGPRRFSNTDSLASASTRRSTSSSSSARSSPSTSLNESGMPLWAQPPKNRNSISGRALSFGSIMDRPDVDFDADLFEGEGDEFVEVIKGKEGRIAVKSTNMLYEILVWLPKFSPDSITVVTRGQRTIHIVADQWEESDHAQWDIKLGEDADLSSVQAKFALNELKISVRRKPKMPVATFAFFRNSASSGFSAPAALEGSAVAQNLLQHPPPSSFKQPPLATFGVAQPARASAPTGLANAMSRSLH